MQNGCIATPSRYRGCSSQKRESADRLCARFAEFRTREVLALKDRCLARLALLPSSHSASLARDDKTATLLRWPPTLAWCADAYAPLPPVCGSDSAHSHPRPPPPRRPRRRFPCRHHSSQLRLFERPSFSLLSTRQASRNDPRLASPCSTSSRPPAHSPRSCPPSFCVCCAGLW